MTSESPAEFIEAYVVDVIRRLPHRQRDDVGYELRALLTDELEGRAHDAGRAADAGMVLDLLRRFGHPDDVASRYRPPGVAIIPPSETARFVWLAAPGVLLQWALTLPMALAADGAPGLSRIGAWWITYGLGALWWPGFIVAIATAGAFIRQRWPAADGAAAWSPRFVDRDRVNRPVFAVGIAAALCGVGVWVAVVWLQASFDGPLASILAVTEDFLATRAPAVLLFWAASIVLLTVVLIEGRWRGLTSRLYAGINLVGGAMMLWFILGGPIFIAEVTDLVAKVALGAMVALILAAVFLKVWRGRTRIHAPPVFSGGPFA